MSEDEAKAMLDGVAAQLAKAFRTAEEAYDRGFRAGCVRTMALVCTHEPPCQCFADGVEPS